MSNTIFKRIYFVLLSIIIVFFDQFTKYFISKNYEFLVNKKLIFLSLDYVKNYGAAFNLLSGSRILLSFISIFVTILLVYFIVRLQHLKKIGIYDLEPNYKIQDDSNYWNKMEAVFMDKNGMPMDNGAREYAKIGSELVPENVEIIDNILIRGISGPINQYDSLR